MTTAVVTPIGRHAGELELIGKTRRCVEEAGMIWIPITDGYTDQPSLQATSRGGVALIKEIKPLAEKYRAGYLWAMSIGAYKIIEVDIGHLHDCDAWCVDLLQEMESLLEGHEAVHSSRFMPGGLHSHHWLTGRYWLSRIGSWVGRWLLGIPLTDCTAGLMGFRVDYLKRKGFEDWRMVSKGHIYQTEVKYRTRDADMVEIYQVQAPSGSSLRWREIPEAVKVAALMLLDRAGIRRLK